MLQHRLPSGKRVLMYSAIQSLNAELLWVRQHDVQPDVLLKSPYNDLSTEKQLDQVRRWLAGVPLGPKAPVRYWAAKAPPASGAR